MTPQFCTAVIAPDDDQATLSRRRRGAPVPRKGRSFQADCLGLVTCGRVEAPNRNTARPVFAVFAGPEITLRPFIGNLLRGRKAALLTSEREHGSRHFSPGGADYVEVLRTSRCRVSWQRYPDMGASIATVWMPDLFAIEPVDGMAAAPLSPTTDGTGDSAVVAQSPGIISFLTMPTARWLAGLHIEGENAAVEHLRRYRATYANTPWPDHVLRAIVRRAPLFCSAIDRRVGAPILQDIRFHAQLLLSAWDRTSGGVHGDPVFDLGNCARLRWSTSPRGALWHVGLDQLGYEPPMIFSFYVATMYEWLVEELGEFARLCAAHPGT